jgi:hypothetical protein
LLSNAKTVSHRSSAPRPQALDPVRSISLAYCWVSMTPLRLGPLSIHRGHRPLDSHGFFHTQSIPTPEDFLVLFLPLTPGNSILKSFNALPLWRTTWHHCHSLLGFSCSLPRYCRPVLVFHVVHVNPDYHGLRIILAWLVVHSIGLPRTHVILACLPFTWLVLSVLPTPTDS